MILVEYSVAHSQQSPWISLVFARTQQAMVVVPLGMMQLLAAAAAGTAGSLMLLVSGCLSLSRQWKAAVDTWLRRLLHAQD